jgi:hypothetical protein
VIEAWLLEKPANRIVVNGPTSQGAVGYSTNLMPSMSLGCGPQAGNITSDNISARHMINVKRAAFPKKDWETIWAKDHARAAQLGGERAPRGSGLSGHPALRRRGVSTLTPSSASVSSEPKSNWTGNPPVFPRPEPAPRAESRPSAPRFTEPRASDAPVAVLRTAPLAPPPIQATQATRASATSSPTARVASSGPYAGTSLSPQEILGILAHAGSGCPLGPCLGCRHHDVLSGACTA